MKAAVLNELTKPLTVDEIELRAPGPREALVKMAASGVCHTDYSITQGTLNVMPNPPLPMIVGHEGAAIVEEVGSEVTGLAPGDHVVLSTSGCGRCRHCLTGKPFLCMWGGVVSRQPTKNFTRGGQPVFHFSHGTFAEYSVVPQESCIKIREDMPLDKACLLGCGVMTGIGAAMNTAKVAPGSSVLVIGCGGVGLNVIQGAALCGARMIIAADILDNKLEFARTFGATHTINSKEQDLVAAVKDLTHGVGVEYSFEVIAAVPTIRLAFESLAVDGLCTVVGAAPPGAEVSIPIDLLFWERAIRGCFMGSGRPPMDIPRLVELYMNKKIKLDELVSQRLPLEGINQAFDDMQNGKVARTVLNYLS